MTGDNPFTCLRREEEMICRSYIFEPVCFG